MRLRISKNLVRVLGIPTIMVSPIGKIIWLYSIQKYLLKSYFSLATYAIIILILMCYSLFTDSFIFNHAILFDLVVILNLLFVSNLAIQKEYNLNLNLLHSYFIPFITFIIVSLLFERVYMVNDYGQPRIVLGFGPATASILFAILTLVYWLDKKRSIFSPILIISVSLLLLSGGRTPIAVTGLIVFLTLFNKSLRRRHALLYILAGTGAIYFSGLIDAIVERSGVSSISSLNEISTSGRMLVWSAILEETQFHIFRVNLGHQLHILENIRDIIGFNEDQYHSELLRSYVMLGLSGVIWYIVLIVIFFIRMVSMTNSIMSSVIFALLMIGLTDNTLIYLHFWALLYLIMVRPDAR